MYNYVVWYLLQPYPLLLAFTGIALANLWRKRRETRRRLLLVLVPYLVLLAMSMPVVGDFLVGSLEHQFPPLRSGPADAGAIVVLSSYVHAAYAGKSAEPDESTYLRCMRAAEVYRDGAACPVIVSGGLTNLDEWAVNGAEAMRDLLIQFGVKEGDIRTERRSFNTYRNAVETGKLLDELGVKKIVLVTDATHLMRAVGCFERLGYEVIPCGCRYRAWDFEWSLGKFTPSANVFRGCHNACHEWLGYAWYRLQGRL